MYVPSNSIEKTIYKDFLQTEKISCQTAMSHLTRMFLKLAQQVLTHSNFTRFKQKHEKTFDILKFKIVT